MVRTLASTSWGSFATATVSFAWFGGRGVQTAASWLQVGIPTTPPTRECFPSRFYGAQPPPIWLRGESTKQLDCRAGQRRACTLFTGRAADRTPWVEF